MTEIMRALPTPTLTTYSFGGCFGLSTECGLCHLAEATATKKRKRNELAEDESKMSFVARVRGSK